MLKEDNSALQRQNFGPSHPRMSVAQLLLGYSIDNLMANIESFVL